MPRSLFEYIDRGAEDETALTAITETLDRLRFRPRVLAGIETPQLEVDVFGRRLAAPLVIAPTAFAGIVAHRGEEKLARAAARCGIPTSVSTQSISTVEEIR